jgi:ABC-type transporter Mla subunit MlaD
MTKPPADRWLQIGGATFTAGTGLAAAWLVHVKQQGTSYWEWPGGVGVALVVLGLSVLLVALFMRQEHGPTDSLTPGTDSGGLRITGKVTRSNIQVGNGNEMTVNDAGGRAS